MHLSVKLLISETSPLLISPREIKFGANKSGYQILENLTSITKHKVYTKQTLF